MRTNTCKHYNGTHHNTHCEAGVCFRDVTTDPDRLEGSAFRTPCILWDQPDDEFPYCPLSDLQLEEYKLRGTCDKFELPTEEEVERDRARLEARLNEVIASLNKGIVPEGVMVCGPNAPGSGRCKCGCPDGPCAHKWDGPVIEDGGMSSETCSICGWDAFSHSMWVGE